MSESIGTVVHHNFVSSKLTGVAAVHEMESAAAVEVLSGVVRRMEDRVVVSSGSWVMCRWCPCIRGVPILAWGCLVSLLECICLTWGVEVSIC